MSLVIFLQNCENVYKRLFIFILITANNKILPLIVVTDNINVFIKRISDVPLINIIRLIFFYSLYDCYLTFVTVKLYKNYERTLGVYSIQIVLVFLIVLFDYLRYYRYMCNSYEKMFWGSQLCSLLFYEFMLGIAKCRFRSSISLNLICVFLFYNFENGSKHNLSKCSWIAN